MNLTNLIKSLDTKTLLSLYNNLTQKSTSKFASRDRGEAQTVGAAKVAGREVVEKELSKLGVVVESNPLTPKAKPKTAAINSVPVTDEQAKKHLDTLSKAIIGSPKARRKPRGTNLEPLPGAPVPCRVGSKQSILLDMLAQPGGASMGELIAGLSGGKKPWTEATVRSGFGWDMKQKGYGVRSEFKEGVEYFFIVLPTDDQGNEFDIPPHRPVKGAPKADARQAHLEV